MLGTARGYSVALGHGLQAMHWRKASAVRVVARADKK